MKRPIPLVAAALFFLAPLTTAPAQDASQEILAELKALRLQVSKLEARVASLETEEASPAVSPASTATLSSKETSEKDRWFKRFRQEMHQSEMRVIGGWTEAENWDKIQLKMKPEEITDILGEPDRVKFSVRKDTDEIYIYQGDLDGKGHVIRGEVRIYKGKVAKIEKPTF